MARKLKEVPKIGTPPAVVEELSTALCEAQDDELLAIAIVKVLPGGEIAYVAVGHDTGLRHALVAGAEYLKAFLLDDG